MTRRLAFVDRRDDAGNLVGTVEEIDVPERPYASDPFGESFRRRRVRYRVSISEFAQKAGIRTVDVSSVECGESSLSLIQKAQWWVMLIDVVRAKRGE